MDMREEFEAQAIAFGIEPMDLSTNDDGDYEDAEVSAMWAGFVIGWQASRAALCVELPAHWYDERTGDTVFTTDGVIDALDKAGVPYV